MVECVMEELYCGKTLESSHRIADSVYCRFRKMYEHYRKDTQNSKGVPSDWVIKHALEQSFVISGVWTKNHLIPKIINGKTYSILEESGTDFIGKLKNDGYIENDSALKYLTDEKNRKELLESIDPFCDPRSQSFLKGIESGIEKILNDEQQKLHK